MISRFGALGLSVWAALAGPVEAQIQGIAPPRLGAASNFGQAWNPEMMQAARSLPVTDLRDAVYWRDIEQADGSYVFDGLRETWPDLLSEFGAGMSLTVNNGNPRWDDGETPYSPEAVAAFASFAAAATQRFDAIHTVEVGNEMNSATFVSGPGWDTDLVTRAQSYTALLAETARAVRAVRPDVRILGGAAHSVSLTWFRALFEAGAGEHMDAMVVHPYGIAPEQLGAQLRLLRALPGAGALPIEVTEFGHTDPKVAPAYLLKSYCQMALNGVDRVIWYPLNPRGDDLVALVGADGTVTEVGKTYQILDELRQKGPIAGFAPDPFTYGCQFGANHLILWGEPRRITVSDAVIVQDPTGGFVAPSNLALSMDRPLILSSSEDLAGLVTLAPQTILADSVHQFAFDGHDDPFERRVKSENDGALLELRPGQEKNGAPWSPYLGSSWDGLLRAGPTWVLPSAPSGGPLSVMYRYQAKARMTAEAVVEVAPSPDSVDGVTLTITAAGKTLFSGHIDGPQRIGPLPFSLRRRRALEVTVDPGETSRGDVTRLQVTLRQPGSSDP